MFFPRSTSTYSSQDSAPGRDNWWTFAGVHLITSNWVYEAISVASLGELKFIEALGKGRGFTNALILHANKFKYGQ